MIINKRSKLYCNVAAVLMLSWLSLFFILLTGLIYCLTMFGFYMLITGF